MSRFLTINRAASAAIAQFRIVRLSGDLTVAQSAAATDAHFGICAQPGGATTANSDCDVAVRGIVEAEYGGAVTRGDLLTSDSSGRVITATAAVGANVRIIGMALTTGVLADVQEILISQGSFQG
jgi:hypothetical protein